MKIVKRLTALLLVFCMVFGIMTALAGAEDEQMNGLGSAVFASDLGGMATTDLWSIWNGVASAGKSINTVTFVGDTLAAPSEMDAQIRNTSGIEEAIHTAIGSGTECLYAYGARDVQSEIADYTGFLYGDEETEAYYIYAISQSDMENIERATAAAKKFVQDVASCDVTKPLFLVSHMPLHVSKHDNLGAEIWCEVISYVANCMDVVFFWGHNYEEETEADRNAYYVAKNGEETLSVKVGEEEHTVCPNFTYMNAGYLNVNDSTGRNGVMTMVTIYEESMVFQDYSATEAYTGEHAHNVTVAREFFEEPEVDESVFHYEDYLVAISVAAKANSASIVDIFDPEYEYVEAVTQLDTVFLSNQDYFAYDIALDGYKGKEPIKIKMALIDESININTMMNFRLYSLKDGELSEIQDYTIIGDELIFETTELGIFAFGSADVKVLEGTVLSGLRVLRAPDQTKYFVHDASEGDSYFRIDGLVVEASYTDKDGKEIYKELEWHQFGELDGYSLEYDLSRVGEQYVKVTYSYGGKTFQSGFYITVCQETIEDESTGIVLEFEDPSTVNCEIKENTSDENVQRVLTGLLSNYVSYHFALEGYQAGQEVQVTLPIPEGVTNPDVYHIKDDSYIVTYVRDIVVNNGTVTFTANRFSSYAVGEGEGTDITVDDPLTVAAKKEVDSTKIVYELVTTPSAGQTYIIANTNVAGNANALKVNDFNGKSLTVKSDSGAQNPYIELDQVDASILWTTESGLKFKNENNYLGWRYELNWGIDYYLQISGTERNWTAGNNQIYTTSSLRQNLYLYYNDSWQVSTSQKNVYFYQEADEPIKVMKEGTYSIAGAPDSITKLALPEIRGSELELNSILTFTANDGTVLTDGNLDGVQYSVVDNGDPKGILTEEDGKLVFTGNSGKALVQILYQVEGLDGKMYDVTNYIHVTAQLPIYQIDIAEEETGASITETVVIKGVTAQTTDSLKEVVTYKLDENAESNVLTPNAADITWTSSDESIATVDSKGNVRFTGKEGSVQITVAYEYEEGSSKTDTITYSVSQSHFTIPSDGTDDFPEYPNEGAVRFNKHAKEVGNFNQTGIAQVELSMTGVPYTVGNEIDVVIMLDMSTSISEVSGRHEAAIVAAQKALENLVKNEDGSFNGNRVAIYGFNGWNQNNQTNYNNYHKEAVYEYHPQNETVSGTNNYNISKISGMQTYNDSNYNSTITAIRNDYDLDDGTNYAAALRQCQLTLAATKQPNRDQYVIFMTDGFASTGFAYTTNNGYDVYGNSALGSDGTTGLQNNANIHTKTEYYSTLMKESGVKIYTVGLQVGRGFTTTQTQRGETVLKNIAGTSTGNANTAGNEDYAIFVGPNDNVSDVVGVFEDITQSIMEAATNVVLEDKIADDYTMIFELPSGVSKEAADGMDEFYIDVLEYTLDPTTKERTTSTTLERIYIGLDSKSNTYYPYYYNGTTKTKYPAYDAATKTGVTVATATDGQGKAYVQSIATAYFTYNADTRILDWRTDKLDSKELALSYFLYLDRSAGHEVSEQIPAGSYDTNDYAHLTYTNFKGEECRQYFPVPQMMWNGAQVSYTFYLVDENGNPVNRAGQIVPFTEAVYVTDTYSYKIVWNGLDQSSELEAAIVAQEYLPSVYELYDKQASYTIHVYEDEEGRNLNNHFKISGTEKIAKNTTYVFNTKSDAKKYSAQGNYSAVKPFLCKDYAVTGTAGNYTYNGSGTQYKDKNGKAIYISDEAGTYTVIYNYSSTIVEEGFDFKDTTVAFGVLWKPELKEDVVVIDYGLPVVINVSENDSITGKVVGVRQNAPKDITINSGTYDAAEETSVKLPYGSAQIENNSLTSVRYTLNTMSMDRPEKFYYEAEVSYYENRNGTKVLTTENMYSSVTVIPATTIYYEDNRDWIKYIDGGSSWTTDGTAMDGIQATDRPGEDKIGNGYDADNVYGYDSVYDNQTVFSMGSAHKVTVNANSGALSISTDRITKGECPYAEFTFKGTGFDLISRTDSDSGLIMVTVTEQGTGKKVEQFLVNNYYGVTLQYDEAKKDWIVGSWTQGNGVNAIYQVPVVQVTDLTYGEYKVKVEVAYAASADHTGDSAYSFWLDGVRVYEPADLTPDSNPQSEKSQYVNTVLAAYQADNEANPGWVELRDILLGAGKLSAEDGVVDGVVFIDGDANVYLPDEIKGNEDALEIAEYNNFGPNNEVYLANGQSIAFKLVATAKPNGFQIGAKLGNGTNAELLYRTIENNSLTTSQTISLNSATDRNYVIENITWTQTDTSWESNTMVFTNNTADAIISLTNLKAIGAEFSNLGAVSEDVGEQTDQVQATTGKLFRMARTALSTITMQEDEVQAVEERQTEEVQIVEEKQSGDVKIAVVSSYAMMQGTSNVVSGNTGDVADSESGGSNVPEDSVLGGTDVETKVDVETKADAETTGSVETKADAETTGNVETKEDDGTLNKEDLMNFWENVIKNPISNMMDYVASTFRRSQEAFVLVSGVVAVSMLMVVAIKPEMLQFIFKRR